jgi:hypothetical protein
VIGRLALVSLLALTACKKKETAGSDPPTSSSTTGSSTTPPTPTTPTPSGDKRVTDSNGWTEHKGPGFTVNAPNAATTEKVAATKDVRAFERFTFYKADRESYVVEVTDLTEKDDLGMTLNNMRMALTSGTQNVRGEDLIDPSETMGEVTGRDIWYVVEQGDETLRARSKLLGKGLKIFEVRGIAPRDNGEAEMEKFVESFKLTP